jgi:subfamily B ATP-binding cassette protein MsbA
MKERSKYTGLLLIVVVAIILKNLFLYFCPLCTPPIRNSIANDMRKVFSKILHLPIGYFSDQRKEIS